MTEPKLKDLITMLDFFDPELPVRVVTGAGEPIYFVHKVKPTASEDAILLFIAPISGDVRLERAE